MGNDPISSKASWVLEFTARRKIDYLFSHLNEFTAKLDKVHLESSVRPFAKICELMITAYYSKKEHAIQKELTPLHLERIAAACFDWLIGDFKVAPKAYSMTSLFLLGKTFDWIHPELKLTLEQNYHNQSAAYKARARMILGKLK